MRTTTSRSVLGGGGGKEGQDKEQGGPLGGDNGALALEKMMEMMRLQGEQLQLLAASTSGLRKEVEELKSSKGKEKEEEREEPIPPITAANVARMEAAPHLPRWMSGQCKLLRELLGGLGEEWADEGMEGVEGGEGGAGGDADITLSDPEEGGTPWDKFARGIWVGMVRHQREYGAKWGGSKKGGGGQGASSKGGGEGGGGG